MVLAFNDAGPRYEDERGSIADQDVADLNSVHHPIINISEGNDLEDWMIKSV